MNKIFKVVWSKAKQCYIVVSEVAKNHSGKKKIVVASVLDLHLSIRRQRQMCIRDRCISSFGSECTSDKCTSGNS